MDVEPATQVAQAAQVSDAHNVAPTQSVQASVQANRVASETAAGLCVPLLRRGAFAQFLAGNDARKSFVDGNDLLALVNRSPLGSLPPSYAPDDLVAIVSGHPATARACETTSVCLRRDSAQALRALLGAMRNAGHVGRVESAYRSYKAQCGTFLHWAKEVPEQDHKPSNFCGAVEQSALPGHSQHQLGTTVDLFTEDWVRKGEEDHTGTFRDGFGCSPAGRWLAEHSWRSGFIVSYPIHPDDRVGCSTRWDIPVPPNPRTGYRQEPWHLRYIGLENASAFHDAWVTSGVGTPEEITLEQWLRRQQGIRTEVDLPVCDGCTCGACATLEGEGKTPCGEGSLVLGADGNPVEPSEPPGLIEVRVKVGRESAGTRLVVLEAKVRSPAHTLTQPPVVGPSAERASPVLSLDMTFESVVPYPRTKPRRFDDLPGAWRLAIEPPPRDAKRATRWPWRVSLARPRLSRTWNRANMLLPAVSGEAW
ncbi:MAG: M15 family metallopeptidase, partial [Myxococcales bacterium]